MTIPDAQDFSTNGDRYDAKSLYKIAKGNDALAVNTPRKRPSSGSANAFVGHSSQVGTSQQPQPVASTTSTPSSPFVSAIQPAHKATDVDDALKEQIDKAFEGVDETTDHHLPAYPEAELPRIKSGLLKTLPHALESHFERVFNERAEFWTNKWASEGRTHEILNDKKVENDVGRLASLALTNHAWKDVIRAVAHRFSMLAMISPWPDAIERQKSIYLSLSGYPFDREEFKFAVEKAYAEFFSDMPNNAAEQIQQAYDSKGAAAAAETLRELTDPRTTDPLTAWLILKAAQPTIDKIATKLVPDTYANLKDWSHYKDWAKVFGALSSAVESASRSPGARYDIDALAQKLMAVPAYEKSPYATSALLAMRESVSEGNATLSLAMLKVFANSSIVKQDLASADPTYQYPRVPQTYANPTVTDRLVYVILNGASELRDSTKAAGDKLFRDKLPLELPRQLWGKFVPKGTDEKWLAAHPDAQKAIDADILECNSNADKFMRVAAAVAKYGPLIHHLPYVTDLERVAKIPDAESEADSGLGTAFLHSPAVAKETYRITNVALYENAVERAVTREVDRVPYLDPFQSLGVTAWVARQGHNAGRTAWAAFTTGRAARPVGPGMALYRVATFAVGFWYYLNNWQENKHDPFWVDNQGWRVPGILALYGSGAVIELVNLGARYCNLSLAKGLGLGIGGASTWTATIGGKEVSLNWEGAKEGFIGKSGGIFGSLQKFWSNFILPWYVVATANYFINGDFKRGAAESVSVIGKAMQVFAKPLAKQLVKNNVLKAMATWLGSKVKSSAGRRAAEKAAEAVAKKAWEEAAMEATRDCAMRGMTREATAVMVQDASIEAAKKAILKLAMEGVGEGIEIELSATAAAELGLAVVGAWLVEAAALAMFFLNLRDVEKQKEKFEEYSRDYLLVGGVSPKVIKAISVHDSEGGSIAPVLEALADDLNKNPADLLSWVESVAKTDDDPGGRWGRPNWLQSFVSQAFSVDLDSDGPNFELEVPVARAETKGQDLMAVPSVIFPEEYIKDKFKWHYVHAKTLKGLKEFASVTGHPILEASH
jgi:hypothetical protein